MEQQDKNSQIDGQDDLVAHVVEKRGSPLESKLERSDDPLPAPNRESYDFWYKVRVNIGIRYTEVFYPVVGIIIIAIVLFLLKAIGYQP